ncbi:MAG: hypothetical protein A2747_00195 [Candidatus Yonathbacteria bacterium RIFCSPHIGHO2_01_FULL_44_41]|uniref:Uncharacterized protein n=1 Tax=Candidatus Yonathbacteria bacterium RIFCSPHIGHO2_02_FULL_44_14 TaxID=1802724 RepID=A0A1G2S7W9_9BACT|nr:MAG: hypothetical protein A2747_00195 [Candidatus Yonathbacteria bacterium RIFCSPHIGHO2_01_FULL_44_41]OHA81169.1 MAG: hypothetical protein A3B06_00260 [Candidatus Yonathbacteria bacterium RIFCSPLOWO2_01_FULL_43_20]OHA81213.1 MAG: hypothetical protein A3D51_01255 [Candidatus Yonathbacteria bacterium RIFCSPHIGHO2_02_FULL_44_14]
MDQAEQYKAVMSEIIAKQSIILGPDMAVARAKKVSGIEIGDKGEVISISGDPADALKRLIDTYVELSGQIVKNALGSIFIRYPEIEQMH